jgi:hypothetical protein
VPARTRARAAQRSAAQCRGSPNQRVRVGCTLLQPVGTAGQRGRSKSTRNRAPSQVMETIENVVANLGVADIDQRLEEQLIDGILYAFQEQTQAALTPHGRTAETAPSGPNRRPTCDFRAAAQVTAQRSRLSRLQDDTTVMLNGFGTVVNAFGMRVKLYLPQICGTIKWRLNNKLAKVRQQAADLISRIAVVMKTCNEEPLMGHLGVVLYEYLGEEYPEVRLRARPCPHSAPGLGSPPLHLHQDWARPCHICTRTGLAPSTSAPGQGPLPPRLHRGWAHRRGSLQGAFGTPFGAPGGIPSPHLWALQSVGLHVDTAVPGRNGCMATGGRCITGIPCSRWMTRSVTARPFTSSQVLGSILGALKAIVNVIGMTKMTPPIKDLLPKLTPILKNRSVLATSATGPGSPLPHLDGPIDGRQPGAFASSAVRARKGNGN